MNAKSVDCLTGYLEEENIAKLEVPKNANEFIVWPLKVKQVKKLSVSITNSRRLYWGLDFYAP